MCHWIAWHSLADELACACAVHVPPRENRHSLISQFDLAKVALIFATRLLSLILSVPSQIPEEFFFICFFQKKI